MAASKPAAATASITNTVQVAFLKPAAQTLPHRHSHAQLAIWPPLYRPSQTGPHQQCLPHQIPIPVQGPYREHFQLLQKEVAILHILGSHPHILGLKEVLHADERLYLVTGGAPGERG